MRAALLGLGLGACGRLGFDPEPSNELAIEVAAFETTSNAFTPIPGATLELPPSDARWLLVTTATLQSTSFDEIAAEVHYLVDGIERGIGGTQNTAVDRPGPFQHYVVLDPSPSPQTVAFELRDASTGTARIEQLRAYAIQLPDVVNYEAVDAVTTVTSVALAPAVTFTPAIDPGEYLFFALANSNEGTGSDCYTRWIGAAGAPINSEMHMPRRSLQSQLLIWRETIAAGASFVLESRSGSDTAELRNVRLLAVPTASFPYAYSERTTTISTTTEQIVHELTPSFTADRYLWVSSARVEPDCMNVVDPPPDKQVVFDGIGVTPSTIAHVNDNCAYETTFGVVEILTELPTRLTTTIRSGNGGGVKATGSEIVVLGL